MKNSVCLSVAERLYGLSLIWQEANYNFAFFDRVPNLDWDASHSVCTVLRQHGRRMASLRHAQDRRELDQAVSW